MTIKLYDTLSRTKKPVQPDASGRVSMYVCGPTVYGRAHIGNARPAVVFDVLRRLLVHEYGADKVVYARNITDIDDKIMAKAVAEGVPIETITRRYEDFYLADMGALGVQPPDLAPHATAHVPGMIDMIARLVERGAAYAAEGHVLFNVDADADYGQLSRRPLKEMIAGARVEVAPYKRNPADFVLWKPSAADQPGWESPWGRGRPGWHIECSAMIESELGTTISIHGGGLDLTFPHHENELAQSRCVHDGAPLADIWMHNGFLSMGGGGKMSKSLGNVVGVDELLAQGWHGEVIRLALLSAHYRQPLEWTEELLRQTRNSFDKFCSELEMESLASFDSAPETAPDGAVIVALADDLNTHLAIARIHALVEEIRDQQAIVTSAVASDDVSVEAVARAEARSISLTIRASGRLLGLDFHPTKASHFDQFVDIVEEMEIDDQIAARTAARAAKNFAESDRIRDGLLAAGIVLEDGPGGTTWRRV